MKRGADISMDQLLVPTIVPEGKGVTYFCLLYFFWITNWMREELVNEMMINALKRWSRDVQVADELFQPHHAEHVHMCLFVRGLNAG